MTANRQIKPEDQAVAVRSCFLPTQPQEQRRSQMTATQHVGLFPRSSLLEANRLPFQSERQMTSLELLHILDQALDIADEMRDEFLALQSSDDWVSNYIIRPMEHGHENEPTIVVSSKVSQNPFL
jgi:hypothetical protein